MMTAGPLAGLTVLDLTRVRAGPTAVRYLADWGANCIKVEMPPGAGDMDMGGPRHGPDFQNLHRNKRSITLNLKEPDGKAVFMKLVERAEVVVGNSGADVKFRVGIDYESLKKVNPRIVLGSISGFGQDGPYAERAGFDQIAQGMGGLMWVTGMPGGGPVRAGIAVADVGAGLHCAIGILIALLERETSGQGQWVSSSLQQAMIPMCGFQAARLTVAKDVPGQAGNNHPTSIPTGVFKTKDGYINIAASGGHIYKRFCECIQAPELMTDERFSTDKARAKNRDVLNAEIDKRAATYGSAELVEKLNKAGVPAGPIYKMDEMFADPQVKHLKMAHPVTSPKLGDIELIGQAINMTRTPFEMRSATPEHGEHTETVLKEAGDPRRGRDRRGRPGFRIGSRHLGVREGALDAGAGRPLRQDRRGRQRPSRQVFQADHRPDPRLLRRRRRRRLADLRHPYRLRQLQVRRARGQARPWLPGSRHQDVDGHGRPGLRQGDLLHRPHVQRPGSAGHGPDQPGRAGCRARRLCRQLLQADRRERAAHDARGKADRGRADAPRRQAGFRPHQRAGEGMLRLRGLHRGPPRLHGKAQAAIQGPLTG